MLTKEDLPRLRALIAQVFPAEKLVSEKWDQIAGQMGMVPVSESIRGLKIVLFLVKKIESIVIDDVAILGHEKVLRILGSLERIKNEATGILVALEG